MYFFFFIEIDHLGAEEILEKGFRRVVSQIKCTELKCQLEHDRHWRNVTFPLVLLVASAMFVAHVILPSRYSTKVLS